MEHSLENQPQDIEPAPITIFSFAIEPTTGHATMVGNMSVQEALSLLQRLVIAAEVEETKRLLNHQTQEHTNGQ